MPVEPSIPHVPWISDLGGVHAQGLPWLILITVLVLVLAPTKKMRKAAACLIPRFTLDARLTLSLRTNQ
ncbi:hypothetical protein [Nonomuraea sp. NPDC049141]|uniref:hypothetical protein n=1 Tax=Nonomuraea sp. NPDC049141 TaxID=3155500 RepID=UPI0034115B0D